MKRNRRIMMICSTALIVTLAWIILPGVWPDNESRYTCTAEENLFSLGMESMNETREETFSLREGDAIDVSAVYISGEIDIAITDKNGIPIYEGRNPELGNFQVSIQESSDYTISVSGRQAEGSISFRILRNGD